jgi:hypothetical protein
LGGRGGGKKGEWNVKGGGEREGEGEVEVEGGRETGTAPGLFGVGGGLGGKKVQRAISLPVATRKVRVIGIILGI